MNDPAGVPSRDSRWPWRWAICLLPLLFGITIAVLFWRPLATGAGFIGGDTYNYYFPLKQYYADGLRNGEIRLWHPGIGNGVPVLGESQTGVFYPFNLLAYRFLKLNDAYNAIFLGHYILTFLFTCFLARRTGLGWCSSLFGGVVFVYGWFPARSCLEWAIVTGAWLPAAVLATIGWLETGRVRWMTALPIVLLMQLRAGHFQLAFTTLIAVAVVTILWPIPDGTGVVPWKGPRRFSVFVLIGIGLMLSAPQLLPTWELKERSQRAAADFASTVSYGAVPGWYFFQQQLLPYSTFPVADDLLRQAHADTNMVEAHLYFGVLPLALVVLWCFLRWQPARLALAASGKAARARDGVRKSFAFSNVLGTPPLACDSGCHEATAGACGRTWMALILVGIVLASGLFANILAVFPGFGYFRYPGRYGILAQLGFAMLAGRAAEDWFGGNCKRQCLIILLMALTVCDFHWVSRQVRYVTTTQPPVIDLAHRSQIFALLKPTDRVLAMDGNTLSLSGAACVPPYLGMGPVDYYKMWDPLAGVFSGKLEANPAAISVLQQAGVTHLLTEKPLPAGWPVTPIYVGNDSFLHPRWGRDPREPLYLYRFDATWNRAYVRAVGGQAPVAGSRCSVVIRPHHVVVECSSPVDGELVLTDLMYPDWSVTVDGRIGTPLSKERWRVVPVTAGSHRVEWRYWPWSLVLGVGVATLGFLLWAMFAGLICFSFWAESKIQKHPNSRNS